MNEMKQSKKPLAKAFSWLIQLSVWKKILLGVVVLAVAGFGVAQVMNKNKQIYTFEQVARETISDTVSESGNLTTGQVAVYSTSTGVIEETYVKNGDSVTMGQNLFKVKSVSTPQEKAVAYASYQTASMSKKTSEQNKPLYQSQLEQGRQQVINAAEAVDVMQLRLNVSKPNPTTLLPYTQNEIDSLKSALTSARQNFTSVEQKFVNADANIQSSSASVTSPWLAYQATQDVIVTAPIAGTVGNLLSREGDNVKANIGTGVVPVLVIGNLDHQYILTDVNEVDRPKMNIGQKATVTLSAIKDKTFTGTVEAIDTFGTNTSGVITYNVSVSVDGVSQTISPGMTANIEIETNKKEQVLTVSNAAIKPYKGGKAVQILDPKTNKPISVPVKVGLKSATRTEIVEGIDEGTKIITGLIKAKAATTSIGG